MKQEEKKRKAVEIEKREVRKKKAAEKVQAKKSKAEEKQNKRGKQRKEQHSHHTSDGLLVEEISRNKCAVCLGAYNDDITNNVLMHEWMQCTNPTCAKWIHAECLNKKQASLFVCHLCSTEFL